MLISLVSCGDSAREPEQVNAIKAELKYARYESLGKLEEKAFGAARRCAPSAAASRHAIF